MSASPSQLPTIYRQILGIRFYIGAFTDLMGLTRQGGLIVVPSAPVLVGLRADSAHREALESADFALTDSGFMILLWRLFQREQLPRYSGLKYIRALLQESDFRQPGHTFWVMPTSEDARANLAWLNAQGFALNEADCYIAPLYPRKGPLEDPILRTILADRRPRYVMLNLGGGVQERLGWFLRQSLRAPLAPSSETPQIAELKPPVSNTPPAIICTGAAIAFLSRRQVNIPPWADRLFLGWLMRILSEPTKFIPRYWHALRLIPLLWKYRDRRFSAKGSGR